MEKFYKLLLGTTLLGALLQTAYADNSTTFLGPTLRGTYAGSFTPLSGYLALGELGPKSDRLNLTVGTMLDERMRIKFTGEYLQQRLNYEFASGSAEPWLRQYAVGSDFQYGWCSDFSCYLNLNVYYSYAPGKNLGTTNFFLVQNGGVSLLQDDRRIAGSNVYGVAPGVDFALWHGGMVGLNLNYDNVRYNNVNSPREIDSGLGGTVTLNQTIYENYNLGLLAAVRKPYNDYQASINWSNPAYNGRVGLGLFGEYTAGKSTDVNTWNVGLSVNFVDCSGVPVQHSILSLKNELGSQLCITPATPYAEVANSSTPPQLLSYRPAALGPKLPIVNATFSGGAHS